jgi:hypothetical protein
LVSIPDSEEQDERKRKIPRRIGRDPAPKKKRRKALKTGRRWLVKKIILFSQKETFLLPEYFPPNGL